MRRDRAVVDNKGVLRRGSWRARGSTIYPLKPAPAQDAPHQVRGGGVDQLLAATAWPPVSIQSSTNSARSVGTAGHAVGRAPGSSPDSTAESASSATSCCPLTDQGRSSTRPTPRWTATSASVKSNSVGRRPAHRAGRSTGASTRRFGGQVESDHRRRGRELHVPALIPVEQPPNSGQKVTSGLPKKSEMKLTKKKPKNTTLTSSSTVCHHFGRAVLGSLLFR